MVRVSGRPIDSWCHFENEDIIADNTASLIKHGGYYPQ